MSAEAMSDDFTGVIRGVCCPDLRFIADLIPVASQCHTRRSGQWFARIGGRVRPGIERPVTPSSADSPAASGQTRFERLAHRISEATGHPTAFVIALLVIVIWALTGPIFRFDATWQLVINTGTTIVTFLMVFLIQCIQNRDTAALQLKLDELLWAITDADNNMIEVERDGEHSIEQARQRLRALAEQPDHANERATSEPSG
jgi:low affinity Fe/Cu permease